jgi:hypothetical protein
VSKARKDNKVFKVTMVRQGQLGRKANKVRRENKV